MSGFRKTTGAGKKEGCEMSADGSVQEKQIAMNSHIDAEKSKSPKQKQPFYKNPVLVGSFVVLLGILLIVRNQRSDNNGGVENPGQRDDVTVLGDKIVEAAKMIADSEKQHTDTDFGKMQSDMTVLGDRIVEAAKMLVDFGKQHMNADFGKTQSDADGGSQEEAGYAGNIMFGDRIVEAAKMFIDFEKQRTDSDFETRRLEDMRETPYST